MHTHISIGNLKSYFSTQKYTLISDQLRSISLLLQLSLIYIFNYMYYYNAHEEKYLFIITRNIILNE